MFDFQTICKEVVRISIETADWIQKERENFKIDKVEKKGEHDYVTYVDKGAEKRIVSSLRKIDPSIGFITEEKTDNTKKERFNWVIDPIDGTTNFIHGLSPYSISIALIENDEVVLGVIHEVTQKETFFAWEGGGAYLNGEPIKVSSVAKLNEAFVATGFPYDSFSRLEPFMKSLSFFFTETAGVRRLGSAAADLAYLACGRFDCFYEYNLNPWDVAAGVILVKEAGGKVSDFSNGNNYLFGKEIVASNGAVQDEFLLAIQKYF